MEDSAATGGLGDGLLLDAAAEPGGGRLRWWHTRRRVLCCLWGGTFLFVTAWLSGYVVWLANGCVWFLPFVSDFGASGSPTYGYFATAMTCAALLWVPLWFDHFQATQHAKDPLKAPPTLLEKAQPWVGLACSLGVIGVALDPEDEQLIIHGLSANMVFTGGLFFTGTTT